MHSINNDTLKKLAVYYNQQFTRIYDNSFEPQKVDIKVIGYKHIGEDISGREIIDTIIRVSTLCSKYPRSATNISPMNMSELKWEDSLHEWSEAVSNDAKWIISYDKI